MALGEVLEAAALVFLFTLAEWLEERCVARAAHALTAAAELQPETALLLERAEERPACAAGGACKGGSCCGPSAPQDCTLEGGHSHHACPKECSQHVSFGRGCLLLGAFVQRNPMESREPKTGSS